MNENTNPNHTYFTFSAGSPYIEFSDFFIYSANNFFSAIHELTHFYHYLNKGSISSYNAAHKAIKESFADCIAWYLSRRYYTMMNSGVYNSHWGFYLGQSKQMWECTDTSSENCYTPIYIDLQDDYNQYYELGTQFNMDPISGVPIGTIINLALQNNNWNSLRSAMGNYVGIYYTQSEYNAFIAPYNTYFGV